jgi:hypothetical protein
MLGHLQKRELGAAPLPRPPFKPPSGGLLVLEEGISLASLPFKPLDACSAALHYVDLGGCAAASLADFGGSAETLRGVMTQPLVELYGGCMVVLIC